jgi:hypothetical protein
MGRTSGSRSDSKAIDKLGLSGKREKRKDTNFMNSILKTIIPALGERLDVANG